MAKLTQMLHADRHGPTCIAGFPRDCDPQRKSSVGTAVGADPATQSCSCSCREALAPAANKPFHVLLSPWDEPGSRPPQILPRLLRTSPCTNGDHL